MMQRQIKKEYSKIWCPNVEKPIEQMIKHNKVYIEPRMASQRWETKWTKNKLTLNLGWCPIYEKPNIQLIKLRPMIAFQRWETKWIKNKLR